MEVTRAMSKFTSKTSTSSDFTRGSTLLLAQLGAQSAPLECLLPTNRPLGSFQHRSVPAVSARRRHSAGASCLPDLKHGTRVTAATLPPPSGRPLPAHCVIESMEKASIQLHHSPDIGSTPASIADQTPTPDALLPFRHPFPACVMWECVSPTPFTVPQDQTKK